MSDTSDDRSRAASDADDASENRDPAEVPIRGRLLGLDYGTRRIGIAVCDDMQIIASPIENYTRTTPEMDAEFLRGVVREYQSAGVVVGLPVHMSGDEGDKAAEARGFGEWVSQVTSLPVAFWDERFSSAMADEHLRAAGVRSHRRKELRDQLAAQIILQSYIDSSNRAQAPPSYRD